VALAKHAPERGQKSAATGKPAVPKAHLAGPSSEQMELGEEWNNVIGGDVTSRVLRLYTQTLLLIPLLSPSRRLS